MEEGHLDANEQEKSMPTKLKKRKSKSEEKSSRKKLTKSRLRYENEYRTTILGSLKEDVDKEELELERLVFGGENEILEQLDSELLHENVIDALESKERESESDDGVIHSGDDSISVKSRTPAWKDEDDENILVRDKTNRMRDCHRSLVKRADQKYEMLAREKFLKIAGEPAWADLKKKGRKVDSDESEEDELLQKTGNFVMKSQSLPKGKIDIRKCQNLTEADHQLEVIKSVEFHPLSKVAVVAGYSGTATLYQIDGKTNAKIQSVHFERFPIHAAHFSVDGNELIVGSRAFGHYYSYDMIAGKINKVPWERDMEQSNVKKFCMSPDGKLMVIRGRYGKMHLISARTKEWIQTLKMSDEVGDIIFSKDGSKMYTHSESGDVLVWDMKSRSCVHKFTDQGCVKGTALALSANEQYFAAGSDSGVVNIYDASTVMTCREPNPLKPIMNLTTEITSLKYNHTSELLAVASSFKENAIKLVHFPSMTVFSNFPIQERKLRFISSLDLSPNGGYLMFGNNVGNAFLYRLRHYSNY